MELLEDRLTPATVNWINSSGGDWNTAGNWQDDQGVHRVPGAGDDTVINFSGITVTHSTTAINSINSLNSKANVSIANGTLSIASASTTTDFTLSGGILTGAGTLTVSSAMTWLNGKMSGTGSTVIAAVREPATGQPGSSSVWTLDTRTLSNAGTATFGGAAGLTQFQQNNGSTFDNLPGATITIATSFEWQNQSNGQNTLNNQGSIVKSGDTSTASIEVPLTNSGTIEVDSGTLGLEGGTFSSGSTFVVKPAATVNLITITAVTTNYAGTLAGSGGGTVQLTGGLLAVGAGGLTVNFPDNMLQWTGGGSTPSRAT